jgi:hypothetical protein
MVADKSFENVAEFSCLRTAVANLNCIQEEIKSRLNYTELILPFVLYGCETWSFTLREGHRFVELGLSH